MHGEWLTYEEAAVRLGVSPEAARRRTIRGKWARMPGNDGRTRVRVPDDWRPHGTPPVRTDDAALLHALEGHVASLKAENERLAAQLAAAEARAEKQGAEAAELDARYVAELVAERARTSNCGHGCP